jgi:hypothetical protein
LIEDGRMKILQVINTLLLLGIFIAVYSLANRIEFTVTVDPRPLEVKVVEFER